ncbi:MAG: hypothetical protein ACOCX2_14660 [Armatimonadota bacterium]
MTAVVVMIATVTVTTACAQGNLPQPVQAAVADLAQKLEINEDAINVASFEEVTWPDASLGNPQPGELYAQVETPGYRVFLEAEGERYEYHTDRATRVTLIDEPAAAPDAREEQSVEQETQTRLAIISQARQHLAQRLNIDPRDIYVGAVEEREWPSSALGVEEAEGMYAQVITPGYRMILEVDEELYDYHTDMSGQVKPAGIVDPSIPADGGEIGQADRSPAVEAAVNDLAHRLNLQADEIRVAGVEQVEWPNGSLGLPEPGMMYTMMLVSGERIHLQAKGRTFEYRAGEGESVRYAGVVYPDDADLSILAMNQTDPTDGNNFFDLDRIDPDTGMRLTAVEFVAGFVTTPDGRDVVIKRRTSRSGFMLAHIGADGTVTELGGAFNFGRMALRHDGEMLAYWAQPSLMDRQSRLQIRPRTSAEDRVVEPTIPGMAPGDFRPGELAWTNDGLAFTVRDDRGARSFYWTPDGGVEELGSFAVMGWIPQTRALLIRRVEDSREVLATFIPGQGETALLADVPAMQSADAPHGEQWVVAAVSHGEAPQIQRINWGGSASTRYDLRNVDSATVRVSPLGDTVVVEYRRDEASVVEIVSLEGGLETQRLDDAAGAVPIVD